MLDNPHDQAAYLHDQEGRADHQRMLDEIERAHDLAEMSAGEAIADAVRHDLHVAVRAAIQWLDVPSVLRIVADEVEASDRPDDRDEPW